MKSVTLLNRIFLTLALVMSFGLHQVMQCQLATAGTASDRCSHEHSSSHQQSKPAAPVKSCCESSPCLSYAECSGVEEAAVSQVEIASFQPVVARMILFPATAAARSPTGALSFYSPRAQVPLFVIHHAFLI